MSSSSVFAWNGKLRFDQADPSGWMFFGNAYQLMHACYEDFILNLGFEWDFWFKNPEWAVPIRATSADYRSILKPGQELRIQLKVLNLGDSSFQLRFDISQNSSEPACRIESTHSFLDKKTHRKIPIPSEVRRKLESYL